MRTMRSALAMSVLTLAIVAASPPPSEARPSSHDERMNAPTALSMEYTPPPLPSVASFVNYDAIHLTDRAALPAMDNASISVAEVTALPATEVRITRMRAQMLRNTQSQWRGSTRRAGYQVATRRT